FSDLLYSQYPTVGAFGVFPRLRAADATIRAASSAACLAPLAAACTPPVAITCAAATDITAFANCTGLNSKPPSDTFIPAIPTEVPWLDHEAFILPIKHILPECPNSLSQPRLAPRNEALHP